jgi:hypothetical protein
LLVEAQRRVDDGHTRRRPEDGGAALEAIAVTLRMIGRVRGAIGDPRLAIRLPDGTQITLRETLAHTVACCLDALARAERDVGVDHGQQAARSAAVEAFTEPGGALPHPPREVDRAIEALAVAVGALHDAHACPERAFLYNRLVLDVVARALGSLLCALAMLDALPRALTSGRVDEHRRGRR